MVYPKHENIGSETKCQEAPIAFPPQQQQEQPGLEYLMNPRPIYNNPAYIGSSKLNNKVALITGGDSGIGRAVSIAFAKEGANIVIVYLNETSDATETKNEIEAIGRRCLLIPGDLQDDNFCKSTIETTIQTFAKLDILVNNAAVQFPQNSILDISNEQLEKTFKINFFSYFYMARAALPYFSRGCSIINTSSVTAYEGNKTLIDYSCTKGAITTFTRSLAKSLADSEIRVNAIAPGPIWTPLIPASFKAEQVKCFGVNTPLKRAGQPFELAPIYVYLASDDSRYVTGQTFHVNGGQMVTT